MAVTFNPSITNYKPSFAGKQKTPTSSAHVNLATAADTVSIAAKPVVKNTLGHRAKMFLAALPFGAAALLGASCQDPVVPPTPIDPTVDFTKTSMPDNFKKVLNVIGFKSDAKSGDYLSETELYKEMTNSYHKIKIDYAHSNFDSLIMYEDEVTSGFTDTAKYKLVYTSTPEYLSEYRHTYINNNLYPSNVEYRYALSSDGKSVIKSFGDIPKIRIKKFSTDVIETLLFENSGETPRDKIHVLSAKYENINTKNLKQACNDAVQVAIDSAKTASKKAVKTIR